MKFSPDWLADKLWQRFGDLKHGNERWIDVALEVQHVINGIHADLATVQPQQTATGSAESRILELEKALGEIIKVVGPVLVGGSDAYQIKSIAKKAIRSKP